MRLNAGIFEWLNSPMFIISMVLGEPRYWGMAVPLLLFLYSFYRILKNIFNSELQAKWPNSRSILGLSISIVFLGLIVLSIRGRLAKKSPIRVGTAYFSNNPFLNKMGLNPNFTLMRSYLNERKNKELKLIDPIEAIRNVRRYFQLENKDSTNPIKRLIEPDSVSTLKPNVVLILMESMSAKHLKQFGGTKNLTPFLDSLSEKSINFTNIYSAGTHTFNGVFSTLFSYPALFYKHPMKVVNIPQFNSLPHTLKSLNYSTNYFTTHDGQFDNIEGFLTANSVDKIYTDQHYPAEESLSNLGVPDGYLFQFSIPKLNDENEPFFASFLTGSNHGPYTIPSSYLPRSVDAKEQVVEYADFALRKFMAQAQKQPWFKNTIFVFVADHGVSMDEQYSMPLSYNHIPLLIYSPLFKNQAKKVEQFGSQIDVFPTLLGLLKQSYLNNTLGIDLLASQGRPFTFFCADEQLGIINNEFLLILNKDRNGLYRYHAKDKTNYIHQFPELAQEMETYAKSHMQVADYMLKHNLQFIEN